MGKFTKKKVWQGHHYDNPTPFCRIVDACLGKIEIDQPKERKFLMPSYF